MFQRQVANDKERDNGTGVQVFELLGGGVRVWVDQEAIHMLAVELPSLDPVELTADDAKGLAIALSEMAERLGD